MKSYSEISLGVEKGQSETSFARSKKREQQLSYGKEKNQESADSKRRKESITKSAASRNPAFTNRFHEKIAQNGKI